MSFLNDFCSIGLSFTTDRFRLLYFLVSTAVFLMCTLFSFEYMKGEHKTGRFFVFWGITYFAVVGFMFSGDFFTMFTFFEIMSVASSFWVLQEENEESDYAGRLYLRISVLCGLVMLYGIMLIQHTFGTVSFADIHYVMMNGGNKLDAGIVKAASLMLLVGFGAKAGMFLLHVWLPRAHTVAPATASAVLSGILTKTGIIGIMITSTTLGLISNEFWGTLLLVFGGCTMFVGAALAVFSTNLKRTLACSSVSQIGFIITGISTMVLSGGGLFEFTGTLTHMLNHSIIKLILFLVAGGVLKKTKSLDLNTIRGYGRNKPFLMIPFAIGALSLSGVPGFSGYISKTLLHEGVEFLAEEFPVAEVVGLVFTITGGITLCYMTKLFVCIFIEKGEAEKKPNLTWLSTLCVVIPALVLLAMGPVPTMTVKLISSFGLTEYMAYGAPEGELFEMHWFSFHTMKGGLISICIGIALYFLFVRLCLMKKTEKGKVYINALPAWFDLEKYIYRPVILVFLPFVCACFSRILDKMTDLIAYFIKTRFLTAIMNKRKERVHSGISYVLGSIMEFFTGGKKRLAKNPERKSFTARLALINAETGKMARVLERSLSLSLLMFSVGLLIALFYMVFR
ncbi:MAG: complex I subunit 5 family protein [Lachnospiraceae bacterium]|nr:complex I subunit 5 family protein [Lachnospiraceae bacterium]